MKFDPQDLLKLRNVRRVAQVFFFSLFLFLVFVTDLRYLKGYPASIFLELDPLVAFATAITTHTVYMGLLWSVALILPTLLFGRIFCNWICPYGILHHFTGWLLGKSRAEERERIEANRYKKLYSLKYVILIAMIAASVGALGGVGAALIAFLQKSRENAWSVAKEAREEQRHEFAEIHGDKINQILSNQENLMSQVTNWAAQEEADLTTISTTLDGIVSGVAALDVLIANFQNSPGTLSPADQASLDAIQASVKLLVTKTAAIVVAPPVPVPPAV